MGRCPDLVPTVAAAACFAKGTTVITNVAHLRLKESDRIDAVAENCTRAGAAVTTLADGLRIHPKPLPAGQSIAFASFGDHRMAMYAGEMPASCVGAFLMGLKTKGESAVEIAAGVTTALEEARLVPGLSGPRIDTCGTGGDNSCSFNCSTAVALYLAALGHRVVKHVRFILHRGSAFKKIHSPGLTGLYNCGPAPLGQGDDEAVAGNRDNAKFYFRNICQHAAGHHQNVGVLQQQIGDVLCVKHLALCQECEEGKNHDQRDHHRILFQKGHEIHSGTSPGKRFGLVNRFFLYHLSMAYLSLENGVGGAVLVNGDLYAGDNRRSGEFGHMCVEPGGLPCKCGKRGCLEAYCSARRISDDINITLKDFFAGVERHD